MKNKFINRKILSLFILILLLFSFNYTKNNIMNNNIKSEEENNKYFFLDSIMLLEIYDEDVDKNKILNIVKAEVENLEKKFSIHLKDSEVIEINKNAGVRPIKVSEETFYLIKESLRFSKLTNGKFDVTIGPLTKLWDIGNNEGNIPPKEAIKEAIKKISYKKIKLNEKNKTVFLEEKGMILDLGAIAKGYVADKVGEILHENKVKSAILNLGGNVDIYGSKKGDYFNIGIKDPNKKDAFSYMGIYKGKNESVVTSGIYERFFEKDGYIYHHIFSKDTGFPVVNDLVSVTIITKSSMIADALSTSVFAMGLDEGYKFIENLDDVNGIFITKDKKVYITPNIKNNFNITNKDYVLKQFKK